MATYRQFLHLLMLTILLVINFGNINGQQQDDPQGRDLNFKEIDEIMRLRGYIATEHIVTTKDGYNLSLIRCTNPLINGGRKGLSYREIILFSHGTLSNNNYIVVRSVNARPRNYSGIDPSTMSVDELAVFLRYDPAKGNLPMLLPQFGFEFWFLNRRGSPKSRTKANGDNPGPEITTGGVAGINSTVNDYVQQSRSAATSPAPLVSSLLVGLLQQVSQTVNGDFWAYSLDEQAKYDLPEVIDYILQVTGRKTLALIGHSTGSAITLMALASQPSLANKISQAHLAAAAVELGRSPEEAAKLVSLNALGPYIGPVPPLVAEPVLESALATLCSGNATDVTACKAINDLNFGDSGLNVRYTAGFHSGFPKAVAARELAHLTQPIIQNTTRMFNFGNAPQNRAKYGQDDPPEYDFGAITLDDITLYGGNDDGLVGPLDILSVARKMTIKPTVKFLLDGDKWNHVSYFLHSRNHIFFNIPVLKQLASIVVQ